MNSSNQAYSVYSSATGKYGRELSRSEYDYGNGASGPLLRTTTTTYLALNNSTYKTYNLFDLPSSVQVTDGGGAQRAYTLYNYDQYSLVSSGITTQHVTPPNGTYRGNLTSTLRWLNGSTVATTNCSISVSNGNLPNYKTYYDTGMVATSVDSCGTSYIDANHKTSYTYSSTYAGTLLTNVTMPPTPNVPQGQSANYAYDFNTGLLLSSSDPNNQSTSQQYDQLLRTTQISYPDGGQTTFCYTDSGGPTCTQASPPYNVVITEKITGSLNKTSTLVLDGLGRLAQTQLNSDPEGVTYTQTQYDGLGRKYKVWNPTRCSPATTNCGESSWGFTITSYDALNRPTSVTKQDGSTITTAYCGSTTLVTDEAGRWRRSTTDGLGRLIEVDEPNSTTAAVNSNGCRGTGEPIWVTTYSYDALDDLTGVSQSGSRQRSFVYDSLKDLTSSANPETGTTPVTYGYDADNNVVTKQDGRSITITYSYDALNRITGRTYSNGDPSVSYSYDQAACLGQPACYNVGRRTSVADAAGSESFAYDKMGRNVAEQRTTNSVTKSASYTYNFDGSLVTLTYPSGRVITYTPDSAGRPTAAQDVANGITYALGSCPNGSPTNGACYAPSGAVAQIQNGTNLVSTYIYNNRLQPCWIYATTGTALPWQPTTTNCTSTASAGNILDLKYNFNLASGDNGNVVGITNNRDTSRTQSFVYDQLNRIVTATTSSTTGANCWGESYLIDQWANLTSISAATGYSACTQESGLSATVGTNNQLSFTGSSYDASGNMLADGANNYIWNAESEIKSAAGVNYTYDGDGNRVQKSNGKLYWYGSGSQILDESDLSGNILSEYVFFHGKRIAMRVVASGTIYYYAEDMLGSSRTIVQAGQTTPCYDADFYPYGGERVVTNTCPQNYKFEGKERDGETGNDDFGARFYASRLGRWLSADWSSVPSPVPYANLTNPQTLNLYAMVSDNPETFADLDGHMCDTWAEGYCVPDGPEVGQMENLQTQSEVQEQQQQQQGQGQEQGRAQKQSWSSLSAAQQALVTGGERTWNGLSAVQQANFAAITHALEATKLADGSSGLSQVRSVTAINSMDIAVTWKPGAKQEFKDSGFSWRPGWGHHGENGVTRGASTTGLHILFGDRDAGTGHVHIDYRGLGEGHYKSYNSDVGAIGPEKSGGLPISNYERYKSWFGPIPGYIP